jgi:hypothetical protein
MRKRALILVMATLALLGTAAFSSAPARAGWQSSAKDGTWNHGGYLLQNDMWNCPQPACGQQTISADSPSDWGVTATMAAGNTAILTYPDVGKLYNDQPVTHFGAVFDQFTESMPRNVPGLSAEAANDVWLNKWTIEMMIWVDSAGRSLAGGTRIGSATIFGQHFSVWKFGGSEFIFDLDHNETSGTTHILASISWLMRHGDVPASATLTQAEFGWEIASTHGQPAAFTMSRFALHTAVR